MATQAEITEKAVRTSLWRRGDLTYKLREHQLPIYDFIAFGGDPLQRKKPATKTLLNVSRQTGKSFTAVLYAVEHCLKTKFAHVQLLASTGKQMRTILVPALKKILEDCPSDLAPVPLAMDNSWTFPSTGAVLRFDGADNDNAESLRGRSTTLVIFDEAAFISDLEYVVKDIVQPQFIVTKGRMILISTPPENSDHFFKTLCEEAQNDHAYLKMDVYENGFATPEDIENWKKECGGENSTTWRREYLCEFVTDSARSVIPEFTAEVEAKVAKTVEPAGHNHKVVGMDVGFRDPTVCLFGYYDFRSARLKIQKELFIRGREMRTDYLALSIKAIEQKLWGQEPTFRVSDTELVLLNDLQSIHGLTFRATTKDVKEAMVNELRLWITSDRLQIDPDGCPRTINQLRNALWDKQRKIFERDSEGHYDSVDALIYIIRTLPSVISLNPYPRTGPTASDISHMVFDRKVELDDDIKEFSKIAMKDTELDDEDFEEINKLFA